MIKIDGIEIAEHTEEFGILWRDGEESWDFDEEEARVIAWNLEATLIKRHVFVSAAEVAE